jgi:hypothetical protein
MKTTITNYKGDEIEIVLYFAHEFKGRGGWNIKCEVLYDGNRKTFSHYTTDSMFVDHISDMKEDEATYDEIQDAYYDKFYDYFHERIIIWYEDITDLD